MENCLQCMATILIDEGGRAPGSGYQRTGGQCGGEGSFQGGTQPYPSKKGKYASTEQLA